MTVKEYDAKVAAAIDEKFKTAMEEMSKTIPNMIAEAIKDSLSDQANRTKENAKGLPVFVVNKDKPQPGTFEFDETGLNFGKVVRAIASARFTGRSIESAPDILESWGEKEISQTLKDTQEKARQKALQSGTPVAGGFLVPETFSREIIEFLRPMSIVRAAGPRYLPMENNSIKLTRVTQGSQAYYIGESVDIPKSELEFGQLSLQWKKLVALVPISNDLLRYSNPGADGIVRDDIVQAMAQRENQTFLRGRGSNSAPKGLRYWAADANVMEANSTTNLQNVSYDLSNMIVALLNANLPMVRPCWMMAPRTLQYLMNIQTTIGNYAYREEIMRGQFWGYPIKVSTQMPITLTKSDDTAVNDTSEIFFVDMNETILGEAMTMSIDTSSEASYKDGGTLASAYSLDETLIRAIAEHDFVVRRREAVSVLRDVRWGVSG